MALIECSECGGKVSDKAATCPHCGAPTIPGENVTAGSSPSEKTATCSEDKKGVTPTKKKTSPIAIGCLVLMVLGILWMIGVSHKQIRSIVNNPETASDAKRHVAAATNDNTKASSVTSISAEELYAKYGENEVGADNKYKGKMLLVQGTIDSIDKDFLNNIMIRLKTSNMINRVIARMKDTEAAVVANLRKGQIISIQCRGGGLTLGSPVLLDCIMAK